MSRRRKRSDARIILADECPRIGSGERGVIVVTVGRKWVRFRETATNTPGKLPRAVWDRRVRA